MDAAVGDGDDGRLLLDAVLLRVDVEAALDPDRHLVGRGRLRRELGLAQRHAARDDAQVERGAGALVVERQVADVEGLEGLQVDEEAARRLGGAEAKGALVLRAGGRAGGERPDLWMRA